MKKSNPKTEPTPLLLDELFPTASRELLSGTGRQFIERIGVETAQRAVLGVLSGENLRDQTEPLTQQRIAQISAGLVTIFAQGAHKKDFQGLISDSARQRLMTPGRDKASLWLAQWMLGLTGKSVQNVLRSPDQLENYIENFEQAIAYATQQCRDNIGEMRMTLRAGKTQPVELDWQSILRLTTAIGSQTLTIRGSDKSMFGKLFEKLILGSVLTVLGFERVHPQANTKTKNVFWLSDSAADRESDATLLLRPNKLARFDIGFIGQGNPEISKDKLSRFARLIEIEGARHESTTFIIVDRLTETSKTLESAKRVGAEIIQMSLCYWPRDLALKLGERLGFKHELQTMSDTQIHAYLQEKIATIPLQTFLQGVDVETLEAEVEKE